MKRITRSYSGSFSSSYASLWPPSRKQIRESHSLIQPEPQPESQADGSIWRFKKYFDIGVIFIVILCFGMLFSIFSPFFPAEAAKKGMSPTIVGVLFGAFELVVFILTPVWGVLAPRIGFKFLIASGMFLAGGATILFGLLDRAPEGAIYIVMCFLCRIVEAVGVSMYITAAFAYGASFFPDDVAFIYGLLETFNGAGFMLGPPLGGLLFKWGGFILPFLTMGSLILVLGTISTVMLKKSEEEESSSTLSPLLLLKMPLIFVLGISEAVCSMIFSFLDPTFSIFLSEIGIDDPVVVGSLFMVMSLAYTIACLFAGKAVDKMNAPYGFMIVGCAMTAIGYLLLGPSPLIPLFSPTIPSIIVSNIIGFAGLGFLMIPIPKLLTETLQEYGFPDEIETNALVSGVYNCVWYFGSFIGPTTAGAMIDGIGFLWSSTIMAFLAVAICILLTITAIVVRSESWKIRGQYRYAVFLTESSNSTATTTGGRYRSGDNKSEEESNADVYNSGNEAASDVESTELLDYVGELRGPDSARRSGRRSYSSTERTVLNFSSTENA